MSKDDDADDYEVGYGRPPVSTRFQKGRSGNPKGRKRGSKNIATLVNEALQEQVVVNTGGRKCKMSKLQAAFTQQANKAAAGDPKAMKLMLDVLAGEQLHAARSPAVDDLQARRKQHSAVIEALKTRMIEDDDDGA